MVSPSLLRIMDEKLRKATNINCFCGGLVVLALGDAMQIPPIKGYSIYEYMLGAFDELRDYVLSESNPTIRADLLYVKTYLNLNSLNCVWLSKQMRTVDAQRQHAIQVACNPYEDKPMRLLIEEVLTYPLTETDMQELRWQNASVVVCDNTEKHAINAYKMHIVARNRNVPIIRWKRDIQSVQFYRGSITQKSTNMNIIDVAFDQLYDEESALWEYYVQDSQMMLLYNIQPLGKGLSNGTDGTAHGLFWRDSTQAVNATRDTCAAYAGDTVTVTKPSAFIMECTREQLRLHSSWHISDTLVPGRIIIPVTKVITETITLTGQTAARLGVTKVITKHFGCAPTYAITTHKVQGETRDSIILDLSNRKKSPPEASVQYHARQPARTMCSMLVACTRVKHSSDMRYVGVDVEYALKDIRNLQHENFARIITVGFMHSDKYQWNIIAAIEFVKVYLK